MECVPVGIIITIFTIFMLIMLAFIVFLFIDLIYFNIDLMKIYKSVESEVKDQLNYELESADISNDKDLLQVTNVIEYIIDQLTILHDACLDTNRSQSFENAMICLLNARVQAHMAEMYQNGETLSNEDEMYILAELKAREVKNGNQLYEKKDLRRGIIRAIKDAISYTENGVRICAFMLYDATEQKLILCRMKAAFDVCKAGIKSIEKKETEQNVIDDIQLYHEAYEHCVVL
ncbi:hypothetical protein [Ehrlichia canis]|nr:hypothetical protein [Ehrlichia canis]AUO54489.1 hypothetical protein C1I72_01040 [Ehrlichia canis]